MKFYGEKRTIKVDSEYSQIAELEKFWEEMRNRYPDADLFGLGADTSSEKIDYYIGKIDEELFIGCDEVKIPDNNWEEFSCKEDDAEIEKLYRGIFQRGTPDYELESIKDDIFTTRVHFTNKGDEQ
jgi:predicted transcriptional regulator YdeE